MLNNISLDSIDQAVVVKLGVEGLRDVVTFLWAVDCQTCGGPLSGRALSVCVDDLHGHEGEVAVASVHHASCRPSTWGRKAQLAGRFLSFRTQCLMLPDRYLGRTDEVEARFGSPRPTLMVNPSLEVISLVRSESGAWQHLTNMHRTLGLRPPAEARLDRPITAGWVTTTADTVTTHLGNKAWSAPGGARVVKAVRAYGGITLIMTSLLGPNSLQLLNAETYFLDGRYEMGWLGLQGP